MFKDSNVISAEMLQMICFVCIHQHAERNWFFSSEGNVFAVKLYNLSTVD